MPVDLIEVYSALNGMHFSQESLRSTLYMHNWRKFRSLTSDNMERWKAEEKQSQNANRCAFSMICGFGGSKSRLAKAAGAEVAVQQRNEKLHAAVAWSALGRQNLQNTSKHLSTGPLFEVPLSKNCTWLWLQAHLQVKMYKTPVFWSTLGGFDVAKVSGRRNRYIDWYSVGQFINQWVSQSIS